MPIAKDDGERTAATAASPIERQIIEAAAGIRRAQATSLPMDPVRDLIAAGATATDTPNFNPTAIISAGRVQDVGSSMTGKLIDLATQMSSPLEMKQQRGLAAVTEQRQEQVRQQKAELEEEPGPKITPQGDALRGPDHPKNRTGHHNPALRNTRFDSQDSSARTNPAQRNPFGPKRDELLERAKSERKAELVDQVTGVPGMRRDFVDELAMKAGALTTTESTVDYDAPTQADAYSAALEQAKVEAKEMGLTGTAIDVWASQRAPKLMEEEVATAEGDIATRMFKAGVRATRRGVNSGGSNQRQRAMTSAEFAALSPRQKAAVELTSMLAAAAEQDRGVSQKGNPGGDEYDERVEALFNGEGATARYAPATVDVLENIGWTGTATDLDDVLKGKLGFTRQDLKDLERPENKGGTDVRLNTAAKMRDDLQSSLVRAFVAARKEAVPGQNLLGQKRELLGYDELPGFATGESRVVSHAEDGTPVQLNEYFKTAFDFLGDSNTTISPDDVFAQVKANTTDEEFAAFLNFVDLNSREAKNYRQPLGDTEGKTYFDPVEFRQSIAKELREERGRARSR